MHEEVSKTVLASEWVFVDSHVKALRLYSIPASTEKSKLPGEEIGAVGEGGALTSADDPEVK